ncbi:MAG: Hsp20/alpha crystallin family protein [Kofleriaceae bacterium]|jgi:HSP20 family protein|nr:Hsp20/alpha crystallin family protein [Kofleriaceae bacterium]MBP6839690.1 Hsp20/alpha crystallin family protein [Kofleriaceae bacterium]MBP9202927.1 Hsp20/alpha crystallin family protein [Kofleriaceae bacterium]
MSLITRRDATPAFYSRDPFALARELFAWDPLTRQASAFSPSFEVKETADAFVLRADLPGVKQADLDVSFHNGVLSINGSRSSEERKEGESYYVYERQYGAFSRSFSMPDSADGDKVEAKLDDGVLTVNVGKKVNAKPRKIEIASKK